MMRVKETWALRYLLHVAVFSTAFSAAQFAQAHERHEQRIDDWRKQETERTLTFLRADPSFPFYNELESGPYASWYATNDERKRNLLGLGAVMQDGWVYQPRKTTAGQWELRRSRIENYIKENQEWEVLAKFENPAGSGPMKAPRFACSQRRCMLSPPTPTDAKSTWRELDLHTRKFIDTGFSFDAAVSVSQIIWLDEDTLIFTEQRTPGSGEQIIKRWRRETPRHSAEVLLQAVKGESLTLERYADHHGRAIAIARQSRERYVNDRMRERNLGKHAGVLGPEYDYWHIPPVGMPTPLTLPHDTAIIGIQAGQLIVQQAAYGGRLYGGPEGWTVGGNHWDTKALLSVALEQMSRPDASFKLIAAPRKGQSIHVRTLVARDCLLRRTYEYLRPGLHCYRFRAGEWKHESIEFPVEYSSSISPVDLSDPTSHIVLQAWNDMIRPSVLFGVDTAKGTTIELSGRRLLSFDGGTSVMHRHDAVSSDGTKIPYFIAHDRKLRPDGTNPTLIWIYGGWGVPELPTYEKYCKSGFWIEQGGVCVVANIRGGTEMGPQWYVRGVDRQRIYEDVIAVAQDLIQRKITSPRHLGLFGHYIYGGLATAVVSSMRPDLFNAAVVENGMLDTLDPLNRDDYELGSPEVPVERAHLASISPVQNLKSNRTWPILIINADFSDDTQRYIEKSRAIGLPYYVFDMQHARSEKISQDVAVYTYLANRLRPAKSIGDNPR